METHKLHMVENLGIRRTGSKVYFKATQQDHHLVSYELCNLQNTTQTMLFYQYYFINIKTALHSHWIFPCRQL